MRIRRGLQRPADFHEAADKNGNGLLWNKKYPVRRCHAGLHDKKRQDNGCGVHKP